MRALAILRNLIEGGIRPDAPRYRDVVYMRRMRTLNGMVLGLVAACPLTAALFLVSGTDSSTLPIVLLALVGLVVCVLVRRRMHVEAGAHILVSSIVVVLAFRQAEFGGVDMIGQAWLFLPPMVAGLTLGVRGAALYTAAITLQIGLFAALESFGVRFPVPILASHLPVYSAAVQIMSGWAFFIVVYVYLETQRSAERALLLANHKLERSRNQANEATRAKSQFLANMSHEIRTPMNVIFGMTEMIEADGGLTREQRHCLDRTRNAATTLLALVDDILDLSRIEAGKMVLEPVELHLRRLLEGVADLLRPRATEKGIRLDCWIADDVPEVLHGDALRLRQVVTNLVGNAVKFTEHGQVVVRALLVEERESVAVIAICVEDTGIGIPEARHAAVFESFTQAGGDPTRRQGGTGLGLTICRQLVQLMGGSIELSSEEGRGSRFRVELPLHKREQRDASGSPPAGDEEAALPQAARAVNQ